MRKMTKRSVALVAGSVIAVAGGTAAFAYASGWFQGSGTVTGTASTIKNVQATVSLANDAQNRLYPGRAVAITASSISNPNDYPVTVSAIQVASVESNPTGCTQSEAGFTFIETPTDLVIPAGTTTNTVSLGKIHMSQNAAPACAGARIKVNATLTGGIAASPAAPSPTA